MNKKLIFTILIACFIFLGISSVSYAQELNASTPKRKYKVEISFALPTSSTTISILHMPIERVSVNMRTLVATGTVVLAGNSDLHHTLGEAINIQYYTDDDYTIRTASAVYRQTSDKSYSFVTEPIIIDTNSEYISYKIVAKATDGSTGAYPSDDNVYIEANLKQMKSQSLGTDGGLFVFHSGDQTRGNTLQHMPAGALLSASNFRIKELYTSETLPHVGSLRPIIAYEFTPADVLVNSQSLMPTITLYYGDLPQNMNNIEVRWLNGTKWDNVSFTNDTDMRTVTVSLSLTNTKLGYYAIFDKSPLTDNDYRPEYRVFRLGEKLTFRNLQAGDSVTIYDINSRQVKKLTTAPFEWDGRKDDGGYAESGSYIYQIKVNGKIISGSTVFVR